MKERCKTDIGATALQSCCRVFARLGIFRGKSFRARTPDNRPGGLLLLSILTLPLHANEALDLIEEQTTGRTYIPLKVIEPKPVQATAQQEERKILHVMPTPWLKQRPVPKLLVTEAAAPVINEASFGGLLEFGSHYGKLDQTDIDSSRLRRARFTTMLGLFYRGTLETSGLLDGDGEYAGIDRLSLRQYLSGNIAVTVGKFRPPFGHFYSTDPSLRDIPDLPVLTRQLSPANTLGVYADGYSGNWDWGAGWFSGDVAHGVPGIEGSGFTMGHLGYTFHKDDAAKELQRWSFDLIWNLEGNNNEAIAGGSRQLVATGLQFQKDRYDLVGEFLLAHGGDLGSVWGFTMQGSYWLANDLLKFVSRYHYAGAGDSAVADPAAVTPGDFGAITADYGIPRPGSGAQGPGQGSVTVNADEFHSFYAGLNLHLLQQYAIFHAGAEYSVLKTRDGESIDAWTVMTGMRVAF